MKPFNLELAKAGHPVCTKDGRDARIICFDFKNECSKIIALVDNDKEEEEVVSYKNDGSCSHICDLTKYDLMMKSTKKEGWINIYKHSCHYASRRIYKSKEEAFENHNNGDYIDTIKIEWEE